MPGSAILLFEDETVMRLFPALRRGWSLKGEQALAPISGKNARRVLFGVINMKTGHRIVARCRNRGQAGFEQFLRLVRHCYKGRPIRMLLDKAGCHKPPGSLTLADTLKINLLWLPKQCPGLNAMDHLWRELKNRISSNDQYQDIDQHAQMAEQYILNLTNKEALIKAAILSENFWLKSFFS